MTDFDFNKCKNCIGRKVQGYCENCDDNDNFQHMTNADRIRTMRDEELARYIDVCMLPDRYLTDHYMSERAIDVILEWMKQEVE